MPAVMPALDCPAEPDRRVAQPSVTAPVTAGPAAVAAEVAEATPERATAEVAEAAAVTVSSVCSVELPGPLLAVASTVEAAPTAAAVAAPADAPPVATATAVAADVASACVPEEPTPASTAAAAAGTSSPDAMPAASMHLSDAQDAASTAATASCTAAAGGSGCSASPPTQCGGLGNTTGAPVSPAVALAEAEPVQDVASALQTVIGSPAPAPPGIESAAAVTMPHDEPAAVLNATAVAAGVELEVQTHTAASESTLHQAPSGSIAVSESTPRAAAARAADDERVDVASPASAARTAANPSPAAAGDSSAAAVTAAGDAGEGWPQALTTADTTTTDATTAASSPAASVGQPLNAALADKAAPLTVLPLAGAKTAGAEVLLPPWMDPPVVKERLQGG